MLRVCRFFDLRYLKAYKAKYLRPKDQHDFDVSAPLLDAGRRAWLERALALCHPGHSWIARLQPGGGHERA